MSERSEYFKGLGHSAVKETRAALSLFWSVFWKVTAVTALLFLLLYFFVQTDELLGPWTEVATVVVVAFGYCLFGAFWFGLGAGLFAVALRWFGAWIVVPVVGAVLGAVAGFALAFVILRGLDLRAGLHGGGEIAAVLVLGIFAVSAVMGAIGGGVLAGVPALLVASSRRRRRRANPDNAELL